MIILRSTFESINRSVSDSPPETGGILGSRNGIAVDEVVMDTPCECTSFKPCSYTPNVSHLNQHILDWHKMGINFVGFFHTHFANVKTLSHGDKQYIQTIMNSIPSSVSFLYFPIFVLPAREMVCYKAIRTSSSLSIAFDNLFIVDNIASPGLEYTE